MEGFTVLDPTIVVAFKIEVMYGVRYFFLPNSFANSKYNVKI